MKGLKRLALCVFALLAIIFAGFFIAIDHIAGAAIEEGARYALGVDTKVGLARIGLLAGTFRVRGLEIDNPPGFEADHLIELGSGRLEVPLDSLLEPVVEVPLMELQSVKVSMEKAGGASNVGTILRNLRRFESSGSPAPPGGIGEAAQRFVIREVVIRDVEAHVEHTERLGAFGAIDVVVPEVRLHDVGGHNADGVNLSELTNIIVKAVFLAILKNGANLPTALLGDLAGGLGKLAVVPIEVLGDAAGALAERLPERVTESVRELGDRAGDAGRKALDGVGKLFRGRRSDE